jgi:hypothetical protein
MRTHEERKAKAPIIFADRLAKFAKQAAKFKEYYAGYADGKEYAATPAFTPSHPTLLAIAIMEISDLDMLADLGVELDEYGSEGIAGFRQGIIDFCREVNPNKTAKGISK